MKCKKCGKEFIQYNKMHLYCSDECKKQVKKEKYIRKPLPEKKCEYCDKVFTQKTTRQKYCSKSCYGTHRQEQLKEKPIIQQTKSTISNLEVDVRKAKESGMSYGRYMAQSYKVKIERKW